MADYICMNGDIPVTFDSDSVPSLDGNPRGEHLMKIAIAFEKEGIDGVRVECIEEKDRVVLIKHLKQDSLAERVLNTIAEKGKKTNRFLSVELAIALAKHVQEMEGGRHG